MKGLPQDGCNDREKVMHYKGGLVVGHSVDGRHLMLAVTGL